MTKRVQLLALRTMNCAQLRMLIRRVVAKQSAAQHPPARAEQRLWARVRLGVSPRRQRRLAGLPLLPPQQLAIAVQVAAGTVVCVNSVGGAACQQLRQGGRREGMSGESMHRQGWVQQVRTRARRRGGQWQHLAGSAGLPPSQSSAGRRHSCSSGREGWRLAGKCRAAAASGGGERRQASEHLAAPAPHKTPRTALGTCQSGPAARPRSKAPQPTLARLAEGRRGVHSSAVQLLGSPRARKQPRSAVSAWSAGVHHGRSPADEGAPPKRRSLSVTSPSQAQEVVDRKWPRPGFCRRPCKRVLRPVRPWLRSGATHRPRSRSAACQQRPGAPRALCRRWPQRARRPRPLRVPRRARALRASRALRTGERRGMRGCLGARRRCRRRRHLAACSSTVAAACWHAQRPVLHHCVQVGGRLCLRHHGRPSPGARPPGALRLLVCDDVTAAAAAADFLRARKWLLSPAQGTAHACSRGAELACALCCHCR